jgi:hypothetical protein
MYEMPLERGKIREFARAARSTNPAYDGNDAIIPPTFLTTATLIWEPDWRAEIDSLGFDFARIVHGEESYVFHGPPPRAGQTLRVVAKPSDQYEKEGKRGGRLRFGTVVHEFRDEADRLVVEQRTTFIETGKPIDGS